MLYLGILSQLTLEIICSCSPYTMQQYQDLRNGTLHLKLLGCGSCSVVWYSRVSETGSILSSGEKFGGTYKWVHCKNIISFTGPVTEILSFSQTQSRKCLPTVMTSINTEPLSEALSSVHNTRWCIESRNPVILSVIWSWAQISFFTAAAARTASCLIMVQKQEDNCRNLIMFCAWQWRYGSSLTGTHI